MLLLTVWASEEPLEPYSSQFIQATYVPDPPKRFISPKVECSCISWALGYLGLKSQGWGIPEAIPNLELLPTVGGLVVTSEGSWGHVGVVTKIEADKVYIVEANFKPCIVSTRSLPIDSPSIRGYLVL